MVFLYMTGATYGRLTAPHDRIIHGHAVCGRGDGEKTRTAGKAVRVLKHPDV